MTELQFVDIREILDELEIDYRESGKNVGQDWIGVCCPFCEDDHNFHLGIHLKSPVTHCFRCADGKGNILTYLAKELNSYTKAYKLIDKHTPLELKETPEEYSNSVTKVELPQRATKNITGFHKAFLRKRKFDWKKLTEKYNLYFNGPVGKYANRIIVPVYRRRKLVTFTTISIEDNSPLRYEHLAEDKSILPVKKLLYGIEKVKRTAVLVEGIFDMFRIGDGAICGFGTNVSEPQKELLTKIENLIICFDGDTPGRKAMNKLADDLTVFTNVQKIYLEEGEDPDSLNQKDLKTIKQLIN